MGDESASRCAVAKWPAYAHSCHFVAIAEGPDSAHVHHCRPGAERLTRKLGGGRNRGAAAVTAMMTLIGHRVPDCYAADAGYDGFLDRAGGSPRHDALLAPMNSGAKRGRSRKENFLASQFDFRKTRFMLI